MHYQPLDTVYHGEEKTTKLQQLRLLQNNASCLVGRMIQFATEIYTAENFTELDASIALEVCKSLSHCITRVSETYPIWNYTLYKVFK